MSLNFGAASSSVQFGIGGAANVSNGALTLITLWKPNWGGTTNTGLISFQSGTTERRTFLIDSGALFGDGDFTSGVAFTGSAGDWLWLAMTKPAGAAHYRMHWKNFTAGGAWTHAEAAGAANHSDPGTSDNIWIGANSNFSASLGDVAVSAAKTAELADAAIEAACTAALRDLIAASPSWAVRFMNSAPTSIQDLIGSGHETGRSGTVTNSADPAGFDFSLSAPFEPAVLPAEPPGFISPASIPLPRYDYGSPAVQAATGAAATQQRAITQTSTTKGGQGAAGTTGRAYVTAAGQKGAVGAAATTARQTTRAQAAPSAATTNTVRAVTAEAGQKAALGQTANLAHPVSATAGTAKKTGAAANSGRASVIAAGKKTGIGAASITARHQTVSDGGETEPFEPMRFSFDPSTTASALAGITTARPNIGARSVGSSTLQ